MQNFAQKEKSDTKWIIFGLKCRPHNESSWYCLFQVVLDGHPQFVHAIWVALHTTTFGLPLKCRIHLYE